MIAQHDLPQSNALSQFEPLDELSNIVVRALLDTCQLLLYYRIINIAPSSSEIADFDQGTRNLQCTRLDKRRRRRYHGRQIAGSMLATNNARRVTSYSVIGKARRNT